MPSTPAPSARIVIVMGVAGCGKTSVGAALGGRAGAPFLDGDDFHPVSNVEKMRSGEPLTDADRWPWLEKLGRALADTAEANGSVYAACSALKRAYRDRLRDAAGEQILFLHLDGSRELIAARMAARKGHYMPPSLLDSQFAALEPPEDGENAFRIAIEATLEEIVEECARCVSTARTSA